MSNQSRVAKVLVALLASMTIGAVVLLVLGNNRPQGDLTTFSLSDHISIGSAMRPKVSSPSNRWNTVEVFYSGTTEGDIAQLAAGQGKRDPGDIDCHIVICNGRGQGNGTVLPTRRWQNQASAASTGNGTIRVCVVGDARQSPITQRQRTSLQEVVKHICRHYNIESRSIYYPRNL